MPKDKRKNPLLCILFLHKMRTTAMPFRSNGKAWRKNGVPFRKICKARRKGVLLMKKLRKVSALELFNCRATANFMEKLVARPTIFLE